VVFRSEVLPESDAAFGTDGAVMRHRRPRKLVVQLGREPAGEH
jgi:hypothetical protein